MREVNINTIRTQTAATVTSAAIPAQNLLSFSAQAVATGSAAGTLKLQASNDDPTSGAPTNWSDVTSVTITISGAGTSLIPKTDLCYQWVRFVYTNSGTGTIGVVFKAIGA